MIEQEHALMPTARTLQLTVRGQSQRAYMSDARVFMEWLDTEGLTLDMIDYDAVIRYHAHLLQTYAKATAARRFVVARRLLDVAVKRKVLSENPAKEVVSHIRFDDSSPHTALTKAEARRLLAAVDTSSNKGKRDYALLMLLIYGGIRRSECAAIRLQDITLKQEHYVLTIQSGKGDKARDVPLRPDVFRAIRAYLEATSRQNDAPASHLFTGFLKGQKATQRGITDRQIANIVEGYAARVGVHATPHDLRASAITFFIDTKAPLVVVQRLVGHSDPKTTERYYTRKQDLDNSPVYKVDLNG
jgi:site-specific recombinase XerD